MGKFQFTPQAVTDLFDIWKFIANGSPEAVDQVEEAVFLACELLRSPLAGQTRKDLTPLPLRFWIVQPYLNYLIVYDPEAKPI